MATCSFLRVGRWWGGGRRQRGGGGWVFVLRLCSLLFLPIQSPAPAPLTTPQNPHLLLHCKVLVLDLLQAIPPRHEQLHHDQRVSLVPRLLKLLASILRKHTRPVLTIVVGPVKRALVCGCGCGCGYRCGCEGEGGGGGRGEGKGEQGSATESRGRTEEGEEKRDRDRDRGNTRTEVRSMSRYRARTSCLCRNSAPVIGAALSIREREGPSTTEPSSTPLPLAREGEEEKGRARRHPDASAPFELPSAPCKAFQ